MKKLKFKPVFGIMTNVFNKQMKFKIGQKAKAYSSSIDLRKPVMSAARVVAPRMTSWMGPSRGQAWTSMW